MKRTALLALSAVLASGCMAPPKSNMKVPAWEIPVSAVMLPFDGIIRTATLWDEAKAKKGDSNAALSLAKQQLDWGAGRSYFEYQSQQWYAKAKELKHPQAQGPYEQWRESYTPPPASNSSDWLTPLIPLFIK
jgi:hypothetical protein